MQIVKWFSVLVAAGHGERCNFLKTSIRMGVKSDEDYEVQINSISDEINPLFKDIDNKFFSIDLEKNKIVGSGEIILFRRMLESAMEEGLWFGQMAALS